MSTEETGQATDTASKPAPLLQLLGDPAAAVCIDGFCAVPETTAVPGVDTKTTNARTTNARTTNAKTVDTKTTDTKTVDTMTTNTSGADE